MNSRVGSSCLDTFLISRDLYDSGCVTKYEILDFLEHGSDHSPVYVKLKVYPTWVRKQDPPRRRILKSSGIEMLRKRMESRSGSRQKLVSRILSYFSQIMWSTAKSRREMNILWEHWVSKFNALIENLIGTRWARVSSWGRKFDPVVRRVCKEASIARSWFIKAKRAGRDFNEYFLKWKEARESYVMAWEKSNRQWHIDSVKRAIESGDIAVWRLLGDKWKKTSRPIVGSNDEVLTSLIEAELRRFHLNPQKETLLFRLGSVSQ